MPRASLQILLAIVLGMAATYYWDPRTGQVADPDTSARRQGLPRAYLQSPLSRTYNEQGNLTDILEAASVEQYPQRDESLIEAPRFYALSGDDKTWSATAARGSFRHSTETLTLLDNVSLSHDQTGARVATAALDIDLDTKTATSRNPVTITYDDNVTRADGMIARLEMETITLMPNVESIYVQPPPR
jgi:lipopolysaccharide export system protein LptC